jgi:hypothetical protein
MTLTIDLPPERENTVLQRAAQQGQDISTFILQAVQEKLARAPHLDEAEPAFEIPPGIRRSQEAFWRDLPELLQKKKNHGQWVAYHGDERIGIGAYETLLREILRRGIPDDQYYKAQIRPRELPPWEPEEVEAIGSQHLEDYDGES